MQDPALPVDDILDTVATALDTLGLCVLPDFIPPAQVAALAADLHRRLEAGAFHAAGIGRGAALEIRNEVRGDQILWLERSTSPAARDWLDRMERLRLAINRQLYLGLFDFECHYAAYPPGTFYRRHLDRFASENSRTVSAILYLNPDWQETDGGALRIYDGPQPDSSWQDVRPQAGTFVCFLSDRIHHEVLPTARERLSVTGWFRRRQ